jgi:hypothetical protein
MFSTGSKLFLGLTGSAVAGTVVYGFFQKWDTLGVIGLGAAVLALAIIAGVTIFVRDGDVAADASGTATVNAAQSAPASSLWPLAGGVGGVVLVIGLVTDKRWFIGGVAVLFITLVEWMIQAWAESASSDSAYNARVRGWVIHPLELPLLGAVGLGALIFAFSRVMLKANSTVGPSIFIALAALITVFGFIFTATKRPSKGVIALICTVGAVAVLTAGIWAAAVGERPQLAAEGAIFRGSAAAPPVRNECGADETEADKNASGAVALKSNFTAVITLKGNVLTGTQLGSEIDKLFVSRGATINILFRNENTADVKRRLNVQYLVGAVDANGKPATGLATATVCTNAIGSGKVQALTLMFPKPSAVAPAGKEFKLDVPGIPGASFPVEVLA